jgi:hypothetical protein
LVEAVVREDGTTEWAYTVPGGQPDLDLFGGSASRYEQFLQNLVRADLQRMLGD